MKKQLLLGLILIFAMSFLIAGTPRVYIQKCTLDTGAEAPVTNTGFTTSPDYIVRATIVETGETLGTDLGTPVTSLRISRVGNGGTVPYYTATNLQLGTFPTQWVAGQTILMYVKHIPSNEEVTWNLVIPTSTNLINIQDPAQVIPPATAVQATYTVNMTTNPAGYITPATLGPVTDVTTIYGTYTPDPLAGGTWAPASLTIDAATEWTADGDNWVLNQEFVWTETTQYFDEYKLFVNGPDGYAVMGPNTMLGGMTDYFVTATTAEALYGQYMIADPPAGFHWIANPITVGTDTVFEQVFPVKSQGRRTAMNREDVYRYYTASIEFVLEPDPVYPVFTVVVNGPAGYTVNGVPFPATFTDNSQDYTNDLIGLVLTPDATVDGTWNPPTMTVVDAWFDHQTNTGTTPDPFELIPCVNLYSWEIVAYDGYDQSDQTTPLAATIWYCDQLFAVWGDPNYTWVNIGTTPLMVWYPCGLWQLGTYRVSHPDYDDDTWVWNQIVWENIFEDYAYTDWYGFRNENGNVPVELSSFTALNVDRNVRLTWVSQTETEMIGYRVLRSNVNDLASAEAITPTAIAATNTSTTQTYNYTDTEVIENNQYYYWLESVDYNASEFFGPVSVFIEVSAPAVTNVSQIVKSAYPNPFKANSNTTIVVDVKTGEAGTVTVYNILGQVVRTFSVNAGTNNVSWNGKDSRGNACGSGIYFYKLSTPSVTDTKKLVIVK